MKLIHDHFQNHKRHNVPPAQLIIADIPYNVGTDAYGSNPQWYIDGDNSKGQSAVAGKQFFDTDRDFRIPEFMHFTSRLLVKEPKQAGKAGCMIVFCAFDQQMELIAEGKKHGFNRYINLVFRKNFSPQVLKANMKIVGNAEYGVLLYREKLPKFNNHGRMVFNVMDFPRDTVTPKVHPTQKPVALLERLIEIFTDPGEVVLDPCAGSGVTLLAAQNMGADLLGAVTAAYRAYEPDDDEDFTGRLVAVQCVDELAAHEAVEALEGAFFEADVIEHDGQWYARITDLRGSDPNDAIFELGWHGVNVGSIPDTRRATPEGNKE